MERIFTDNLLNAIGMSYFYGDSVDDIRRYITLEKLISDDVYDALNKAEGKRPVYERRLYNCPNCGNVVGRECGYGADKYCYNCGQKFLWSEL